MQKADFVVDDHELDLITRAMTGYAYMLNQEGRTFEAQQHLVIAAKASETKQQYQTSLLPILASTYKFPLDTIPERVVRNG